MSGSSTFRTLRPHHAPGARQKLNTAHCVENRIPGERARKVCDADVGGRVVGVPPRRPATQPCRSLLALFDDALAHLARHERGG
eukprot:251526-Rhodomonas_salina.1